MENRFLTTTNKLNNSTNRFIPKHKSNGLVKSQSKKAKCTQYSEIEIEADVFVLDILQFFFDERLEPSELNSDLRDIAARALWKATEGSKAMDLVPRPPTGQPGIVWLVSSAVQIAFRRAQNRCIYEAVRRTVKLSMRSEYEIAKQLGTPSSSMQATQSISDKGIALIKRFEGFRSNLYDDPAGHCTIGYGHLVHKGKCNGSEPTEFKSGISEARATELFRQRLVSYENTVSQKVTVSLSQQQFDALVSFTFNVGSGAFSSSTLLRRLNQGQYSEVPSELKKWKYGTVNGVKQVLPGLEKRREKEATLFKDGRYPEDTSTAQDISSFSLDLSEIEAPYSLEFQATVDWCQIRYLIIRSAVEIQGDWLTTGNNLMKESNAAARDMLIKFWRDGVGFSQGVAEESAAKSAADKLPWSAAFISWCVRNAMPTPPPPNYGGFNFSGLHMNYISKALNNRESNNQTQPFWFFDINEDNVIPEDGDIICLNRKSDGIWSQHSYQSIRQNQFPHGRFSHCDIIIGHFEKDGRKWIETIGGNIRNTVSSKHYSLDTNGRLVDEVTLNGQLKRRKVTQAVDTRPPIIFGLIRLTACTS